jgi:DNA-binding response OmpR family regulator
MSESDHPSRIVRFGLFEANLETGELWKRGLRIPLQGQPFQVFAILLEHSGELVTREVLRQKVWPEDTRRFRPCIEYGHYKDPISSGGRCR